MAETQKMYLGDTLLNKTFVGTVGSVQRQPVGGFPYVDTDVIAFLTATEIYSTQIGDAIDTLVTTMKSDGIWSKMTAVYPFVGGTADTHKFNLIDPQDTDAAHRITWGPGITHNSNGITTSGTSLGAGRPYLTTNDLTWSNLSVGLYSRTTGNDGAYDTAAGPGGGNYAFSLSIRIGGNLETKAGGYVIQQETNGAGTGFYQVVRSGTAAAYLVTKNSTLYNENDNSPRAYSGEWYIGGRGTSIGANPDSISSRNYAFATYGSALTSTEMSNYYDAVQAFQTSLGRQV
jgi:hypothetical protein